MEDTDRSGNEICIVSMGRVPVAPVENSDSVVRDSGKRLEEANESMFIVDLQSTYVSLACCGRVLLPVEYIPSIQAGRTFCYSTMQLLNFEFSFNLFR